MARHRARAALLPVYVPGATGSSRRRARPPGASWPFGRVGISEGAPVRGRPAHGWGERTQEARKASQGNTCRVRGAGLPGDGNKLALLSPGIFRISAMRGTFGLSPPFSGRLERKRNPAPRRVFSPIEGSPPGGGRVMRDGRRTPGARDLTVRNRPIAGPGGLRWFMMARPPNRRRHTGFSAERRLKAEWKRISLVWNTFDAFGPARGRLAGPTQCDVRWTHATRGVL